MSELSSKHRQALKQRARMEFKDLDKQLEKKLNAAIKADKKQAVAAKLLKTAQENAAQSERVKGRLSGDVSSAQNMRCE